MKIYTKKGDGGETSLFGGQKVKKSAARIAAYGTVDELNSVLGMALTYPHSDQTGEYLKQLQHDLFVLGADLAAPISKDTRIDRVSESQVEFLECSIDKMDEELPPLKNFILPGGSKAGATIHFARTVCRRAERLAVECGEQEELSSNSIVYLNRLSDFLFVLGRFENYQAGTKETPWISNS